jgi:hypothetical protein
MQACLARWTGLRCRRAAMCEGVASTSMEWVRTNRRFGAWCVLLALTLQIVLSFGHTHRFDGFRPGALSPQAGLPAQPSAEPGTPASKPAGIVYEYCAICAVIEMAASAAPPAMPASVAPAAAGKVRFALHVEAAAAIRERLLFEARAPPSV